MNSWIRRGAAALAPFVSFSALAQETPQQAEDIGEEIIVTATKREASLQDVPFSVAALTASTASS